MKTAVADRGFARWPGQLDARALVELAGLFDRLGSARPGVRIDPCECDALAAVVTVMPSVRAILGDEARAVRALLFDKHEGANWALPWHQDRTIEVAEQADTPGYGPWTQKQGRLHVGPPIALLEHMLTLRIHLDAVPADNAPLHVAPGSHRMGFVPEHDIERVVAICGSSVCLAEAGTIWFYATPILHGSPRAAVGRRRRVLQLDFAATRLPDGLRWAADVARCERRLRAGEVSPKSLPL